MDGSRPSVSSTQRTHNRSHFLFRFGALVLAGFSPLSASAQNPPPPQNRTSIEGTVQDSAGDAVSGASVVLRGSDASATFETKTDAKGVFLFSGFPAGVYTLKAEKAEWGKVVAESVSISAGEKRLISLVLIPNRKGVAEKPSAAQGREATPQFADEPSFAVAGITDWSNAGLHASASDPRASESLARAARALEADAPAGPLADKAAANFPGANAKETEKGLQAALLKNPKDFAANHQLGEFYCRSRRYSEAIPLLTTAFQMNPGDVGNSYDLALAYLGSGDAKRAREQGQRMVSQGDSSEAHRRLGDLDEQLSDALGAVREYQQATRLDASEENYFAWGTELLLHRAVEPAAEVFRKGFAAHPDSVRMLTGLGAALYATGSYEEAGRRLCEASDLKPVDAEPYVFLGKMERAEPAVQDCSREKLARFVAQQPGNALANYYYGLVLWKEAKASQSVAAFDQATNFVEKAVQLNPRLAEGYLQLGILRADRGDLAKAIPAYQQAIELDPQLGEAHYRLAQTYRRSGEAAKAEQEMKAYAEIEKKDAEARRREERDLQQFLIIMKSQPANPTPP